MKLKPLHPRKNFLKFLSLAILVLGGSVGVILATQKQVFDEPEARDNCDVCVKSSDIGNTRCDGNKFQICEPKYKFGPVKWSSGISCAVLTGGTCKQYSGGGKGPGCGAYCTGPNPTPKPTTTTAQCEYSCVANCTSSGGVRKSGTCVSGQCCAIPYTPY